MDPHRPFDAAWRRARRNRHAGAPLFDGLWQAAREELLAREELAGTAPPGPIIERSGRPAAAPSLPGTPTIIMDPAAARLAGKAPIARVVAEEETLPIASGRLARVRLVGGLEGANDLPGALLLARRALVPGGWFSAVLPAGDTLAELRRAFLMADDAHGGVRARVGPMVDPAEAAALLQRAGFDRPVVDVERGKLKPMGLDELAAALRDEGWTGWLAARPRGLMSRARWAKARQLFGQASTSFTLCFLLGRAPG